MIYPTCLEPRHNCCILFGKMQQTHCGAKEVFCQMKIKRKNKLNFFTGRKYKNNL